MKLYEMTDQLLAIDNLLAEMTDPDTNEILQDARAQLLADIDEKCENILEYISHCKARMDYYKAEEERIAQKRKVLDKRVEYLKSMIMMSMKGTGKNKMDCGTYSVSIAKTPAKVVLTDDGDKFLPDEYCTITRTPNKTVIKEAMGSDKELRITFDGRELVLARLDESGESLRIR